MFNRSMFADMRRAGMSAGVSKAKLSKAMLEILAQLPDGTANLKETIVHHLGVLGQMSPTRDITAAWNETKRKAAREFLRGKKSLNQNSVKLPVIYILSPSYFRFSNKSKQTTYKRFYYLVQIILFQSIFSFNGDPLLYRITKKRKDSLLYTKENNEPKVILKTFFCLRQVCRLMLLGPLNYRVRVFAT